MSARAGRESLRLSAAGAVLAALCALLVNLVSSRLYLRADLSADRLYSLSPGSKRVLRSLPGPVEARAYFSNELPPEFAAGRSYARDILREYRSASGGKFRFRFVDVDRDEAGKREALSQGVSPVQFNVVSQERYEVREGLMGLVLQHEDKKEVLAVITKAEGLEYDLTSRILRLTERKKKVVALVSSHKAQGKDRLHESVRESLGTHYQLRSLDLSDLTPGATVPAEVDALLLLGPQERLEPRHLYALDQYLLSGRPLLAAFDTRRSDFQSFMSSTLDTGVPDWLKSYGIRVKQNFVLDMQCQKVTISQAQGWYTISNIVSYPLFVLSTALDRDHPATRGLRGLTLAMASPLEIDGAGLTVRALARSSRQSWLRSSWARGAFFNISPVQELLPGEGDPKGPFTLAAAVEGPFTSHFSTAPQAAHPLPKEADPKTFIPSGRGRLLVAGTSRLAAPEMPAGDAGPVFLMNAVDWMAMEDDLSAIRAKGIVFRPLQEIPPTAKLVLRWFLILTPPGLAMGFGLLRLRSRRGERKRRAAA